jgi:methylthioribose-1-phosphate isomerase
MVADSAAKVRHGRRLAPYLKIAARAEDPVYLCGMAQTTTLWREPDSTAIRYIDQRYLPHRLEVRTANDYRQIVRAIQDMEVRGAPLIGISAAYGLFLAANQAQELPLPEFEQVLAKALSELAHARPTAVNLHWALQQQRQAIMGIQGPEAIAIRLLENADRLRNQDIDTCRRIGEVGLTIIEALHRAHPERPVEILTHCNAGWLGCIEWGTATSPIYQAHAKGIPVHVWVDETRPRNQGAHLTAWELGQRGIPHDLIADNTGGYLMQTHRVDLCIVGCDRVTRRGDVANKIGTYLKALAAADTGIPFYVALPTSTIDWNMTDGLAEIPIEMRNPEEVLTVQGLTPEGELTTVRIAPASTPAINYGFDLTPARLVTAFITEKGLFAPGDLRLLNP